MILDGVAIAHDLKLDPGLLSKWAQRRHIARHGRDAKGRTLYDYDEVARHAVKRGLVDPAVVDV